MDYSYVWVHGQVIPLHTLFFSIMTGLPQKKLIFIWIPLRITPLWQPSPVTNRDLKIFRRVNCLGDTPVSSLV